MAEIAFIGDVIPTVPTGFPFIGSTDPDQNGVADFLTTAGNGSILDGVSPTDPTGGVGGLAWDAPEIWRGFFFPYAVISGVTDNGELTVAGGGNLRIGNLVAGLLPGSNGKITVSGFGSEINNDYLDLDSSNRRAIALAKGITPEQVEIRDLYFGSNTANPFPNVVPPPPIHANVWVGRKGIGSLNIFQGGKFVVRHRLLIGGYEEIEEALFESGSPPIPYLPEPNGHVAKVMAIDTPGDPETLTKGGLGTVFVNGAGSTLTVRGRTAYNNPIPPKTDGTSQENQAQNQFLPQTNLEEGQALPAAITANGLLAIGFGAVAQFDAGLVNHGTILVAGTDSANILGFGAPYSQTDAVPALDNHGVIILRAGSILTINGPIRNFGKIYCESGAVLNTPDGITGPGEVKRSPCCPAAIRIDKNIVRLPKQCAVDIL